VFDHPIDNGFFRITEAQARAVSKDVGGLPRNGCERLVPHEGRYLWLARTNVNGQVVWSVRETRAWRLDEQGNAVSGGPVPVKSL
jgi:hypothetical protein